MARIGIGRHAILCAVTIFAAALVSAGCANGSRGLASGAPNSVPQSGAASSKAVTPAPSSSDIRGRSTPAPPRLKSAPLPPGSTAIVVSMVRQTLAAVTDGDVFGPVTIGDAAKVAQVAALIDAGTPQLPALLQCPMTGPGSMTLEFLSKVGGQKLSTVYISTSGCSGALVRPASGGIVRLTGGADLVRQIESILGLNWPKPNS
jgi:hypothetical protein